MVSAVDPESDVKNICRLVGEALALETMASIAVAGEYQVFARCGGDRTSREGWAHATAAICDSDSGQSS